MRELNNVDKLILWKNRTEYYLAGSVVVQNISSATNFLSALAQRPLYAHFRNRPRLADGLLRRVY